MRPGHFDEDHEMFRDSVRRFFQKEVGPKAEAWRAQGQVDRDIYRLAGEQGLLCI